MRARRGAASPLSASAVKNAMLSACDSPSTKAIRRSCSSRSITTRSAIVEPNSARASASASGIAEVDEDHVAPGQQLGVGAEHRVHRRHAARRPRAARRGPRAAASSASRRRTRRPRGLRAASACSTSFAILIGVATTIRSWPRSVGRPVRDAVVARHLAGRIGDRDREIPATRGSPPTSAPSCRGRRSRAPLRPSRGPARRHAPAPGS